MHHAHIHVNIAAYRLQRDSDSRTIKCKAPCFDDIDEFACLLRCGDRDHHVLVQQHATDRRLYT